MLGYRGARSDTHALHKSFFPLGPFLHSGLCVTLQLVHFMIPTGGCPMLLPLFVYDSFDPRRELFRGAGTTFSLGAGELPAAGEGAGGVSLYCALGGKG